MYFGHNQNLSLNLDPELSGQLAVPNHGAVDSEKDWRQKERKKS
jgi:hypothetical protein